VSYGVQIGSSVAAEPLGQFLDRELLDVARSMHANAKMADGDSREKAVLREAFDGYLPDSKLWR
jgi:asparagine synthase (glutamine-hydrolysing)